MDNQYKYIAFISYNSKDNRKARWLQKRLESYSLPSVIVNEKGEVARSYDKKTKKFRVFRYVTDLVAQNLDDGLRRELDQSKYLIVICSPNSSNAPWVRNEVKHFIETGRKKQIIPFVIKGTPYSNDKNECFTPELKEAFPNGSALGVSLNDIGDDLWIFRKRKAVAKIVSLLIDLPNAYDFLWNRYRNQLIRKIIGNIIFLLLIVSSLIYIYKIDKNFDMKISVIENNISNANLPELRNAEILLCLEGDTFSKKIMSVDETVTFSNVSHKFLEKQANVHFEGYGYLPLDTTITVNELVNLEIQRDMHLYGDIQFLLVDIKNERILPREELWLENIKVVSDDSGRVKTYIPLCHQKQKYKLKSSNLTFVDDTIEAPFTESRIVEAFK